MKEKIGHNSQHKTLEDFKLQNNRFKITNELIEKYLKYDHSKDIKPSDEKGSVILNDSEVVGLKIRARKSGLRSWYFEHTPKGAVRTYKYTLNSYPALKTLAARQLATELKSKIVLGEDPRKIIAEYSNAQSLDMFAKEWIKKVLNVSKRYKQTTKIDTKARLKTWLFLKPCLHSKTNTRTREVINANFKILNIKSKKLRYITHDDAVAYHDAITQSSPSQANRVIDDVQQIFEWAIEQKEIKENPFLLSNDERNIIDKRMVKTRPFLKSQWKTVTKCALLLSKRDKRSTMKCYASLAKAYTGRRPMEVNSMQWNQIDLNNKSIFFSSSDVKNEEAINVPLMPLAQMLFKRLRKIRKQHSKDLTSTKRAYVFPSERKSKKPYLQRTDKTWKKIIKLAQQYDPTIQYKCIYMLRHTFACLLLEATNDIKLVAKIMGWKTLKVAEVYADYLGNEAKEQGLEKLHRSLHAA